MLSGEDEQSETVLQLSCGQSQQNQPERRQKLSSSIISSERKPPLVCLLGRTARNETHVCPTQCPVCGVGRGASHRLQASRLLRAVVWIYRHFQRWEEGIQRRRRELVFTRCLNVTQETFNHRRHEDMRGQGPFISAFTSTPRCVSDRAVERWSRLCLSLSFCSLPVWNDSWSCLSHINSRIVAHM